MLQINEIDTFIKVIVIIETTEWIIGLIVWITIVIIAVGINSSKYFVFSRNVFSLKKCIYWDQRTLDICSFLLHHN